MTRVQIEAKELAGTVDTDLRAAFAGTVWTFKGKNYVVDKVRALANGGLELILQPYNETKYSSVTIDYTGTVRRKSDDVEEL
jgi:hypothetical protein